MSAVEALETPLEAAEALAALGLNVIPIAPGRKYPQLNAWQDAATDDLAIIRSWWNGLYRGHGVGIATGPGSGVWVLDIDIADGKPGRDNLQTLVDRYGLLPQTATTITGSGGLHMFFQWDPARPITNGMATNLPAGLDVRGVGGQVVAPPTTHPNGQLYRWHSGLDPWTVDIAIAPDWLYELLLTEPNPMQPSRTNSRVGAGNSRHEDSIAVWINSTHDWHDELTADGWTLHSTRHDQTWWTRPGKAKKDGHSAVLHEPDGPLVIFTTEAPAGLLHAGTPTRDNSGVSVSMFGYIAATRHGGDRSEAARFARRERNNLERPPGERPVSNEDVWAMVADLDNGNPPPESRPAENLPDDFWDTRPTLRHIRQAAHSRGRSADAVLGNVLARIAAHTPHSFVLPAIVGDYASLNMIIGIVGPSGTGKSTAISLAQHLVEPANQTPLGRLDNAPLGSGEGTIEAYFEMVAEEGDDGKKRMEKRQTTFAGLFISDEIDQLAQQASRSGSTLMPTLRSAWSGGLLGQTNATGERNRRLNGHTYRFVLVVGVQPDKAAGLLDDAAGGTPQRFAWFNAVDPSIPEPGQRPDWPGPIRWANPHLLDDGLEVITLAGRRAGVINIDPVIAEEIAWNDHQRQTGQRNTGVGDSHRDLIRIKIAALLALLEGRTGIDKGDWELAEQVTDVSANILAAMTARAKEIVAERNLAQAAVASLIARRVAEDAEDDALETAVAQVARTAARLHQKGESMSRRKAMQNLSKKAREASLDEAFAVAVDRGLLVATTTEGEWTVPV